MKSNKSSFRFLARLMTLVSALSLTAISVQAQNARGPQEVKVVNTASQPVPVSGTVNLESGASVGINGTPTVTIAAGSSVGIDPAKNAVQLSNTAANPVPVRDVDKPTAQPFQTGGILTIPDMQFSGALNIFAVPADKLLVIEHIDFRMSDEFPPDTVLLKTAVGGELRSHFLFPLRETVTTRYGFGQPTRLYADAGTSVTLHVTRLGNNGSATLQINISGCLVNAP